MVTSVLRLSCFARNEKLHHLKKSCQLNKKRLLPSEELRKEMSALVDNSRVVTSGQEEMASTNRKSQDAGMAGDGSSANHKSQSEPTQHRVADILKDQLCMQQPQNSQDDLEDYQFQSRKSAFSPPSRMKPSGPAKLSLNGGASNSEGSCHSPGSSTPRDFRISSLKMDKSAAGDAPSDVLRGILQGKEHSQEEDAYSKLLHREKELESRLCRNGEFEMGDSEGDSMDLGSSADMAFSDDSDTENNPDRGTDRNSPRMSFNEDEQLNVDDENSVSSTEESMEAKRARVENIISNMHMSPSKVSPDSGIQAPGEVKRPKRKQYIPQQHGGSDEPPSKIPHMEKDALQKQLKQMQDQISIMQQRYSQLFTMNNNNDNRNNNLPEINTEVNEDDLKKFPLCTPTSTKYPQSHDLIEMPRKSASLLEAMDMDPNQFMKEANRAIDKRLPKQQTSPLGGSTPADLDHLARILKTEITSSVGSLVDNIVSRFVEKQSRSRKSTSPSPIAPVKPSPLKSKDSAKDDDKPSRSSHSGSTHTESHSRDRLMPENLSLSISRALTPPLHSSSIVCSTAMKTSPRSEFPADFNALLKPPRTKMSEKLCHPLFEAHMKAFAELPRPQLPLFPPPYFPPALHPVPPLFAKEPEQTEAMPLIVNAPKKKRTKVTDTRLSPRAARALLQETLGHHHSPGPEVMKSSLRSHCSTPGTDDMLPSPFHHHPPPPLVPASLPTSVAIPNPSLQHSEVLAMYSHGDHPMYPDGSRLLRGTQNHSPSSSPNMGHTPSDMHMGMKSSDANSDPFDQMHESYTYEGHPIVSFCATKGNQAVFKMAPTHAIKPISAGSI